MDEILSFLKRTLFILIIPVVGIIVRKISKSIKKILDKLDTLDNDNKY